MTEFFNEMQYQLASNINWKPQTNHLLVRAAFVLGAQQGQKRSPTMHDRVLFFIVPPVPCKTLQTLLWKKLFVLHNVLGTNRDFHVTLEKKNSNNERQH